MISGTAVARAVMIFEDGMIVVKRVLETVIE